MEFDWHPDKDAKIRDERGFGFADVIGIFLGRTIEWEDVRQDYGEKRMIAIGEIDGDFFTVVYTDREVDREPVRWIITAWPSNRKERVKWRG